MKLHRIRFFTGLSLLLGLMLTAGPAWATKPISVVSMSCEHLENPMGIGTAAPRLSWILSSDIPEQVQTANPVLDSTCIETVIFSSQHKYA